MLASNEPARDRQDRGLSRLGAARPGTMQGAAISEQTMTAKRAKRRIRIAYLSGPCNAPAVYHEWREQRQQDYFGTDFMKQFIQLADDLDAESYVITSLPGRRNEQRCGQFIFDNHPVPPGLKG